MNKLKLYRTRILLVCFSTLAAVCLCELLVRVLPLSRFDKTGYGVYRPHLTIGFAFRPNLSRIRWGVDWKTNSKGFRDYEHEYAKQNFRILGLGDSFLVGHEVASEDIFLRQLEKSLKVEVIKLAVTNYGTVQERLLWEEEGKKYNPDIVVLGLFIGNDFGDNLRSPESICIDHGNLVECGDRENRFVRIATFSARHSLLARFLLQRFHTVFPREVKKEASLSGDDPLFRHPESMQRLYSSKWPKHFNRGFQLSLDNLIQLSESTKKQSASFVVLVIPTELQIYDWQWNVFRKKYETQETPFDRYRIQRTLTKFLIENRIRFIDLLPVLKNAGETDLDLHPYHWHWSVKANKLVADTVESYLRKEKLIPGPNY